MTVTAQDSHLKVVSDGILGLLARFDKSRKNRRMKSRICSHGVYIELECQPKYGVMDLTIHHIGYPVCRMRKCLSLWSLKYLRYPEDYVKEMYGTVFQEIQKAYRSRPIIN